jgi:hypothetical protein
VNLTIQASSSVTRKTVMILVHLFKNCFWVVGRWLNSEHSQSYAVVSCVCRSNHPLILFFKAQSTSNPFIRQVDIYDRLQSQLFFNSFVDLKKIFDIQNMNM